MSRKAIKILILNLSIFILISGCKSSDTATDETATADTATTTSTTTDPASTTSACGTSTVTGVTLAQNSGIVTGVELGQKTEEVSLLQKSIVTSVTTANADFTLGTPCATRTTSLSTALYWFIPVTNVSSTTKCFIKGNDLTFTDASGTSLASNSYTYVHGGLAEATLATNTCLAPSETAWFSGIELTEYEKTTQITLGSITSSESTGASSMSLLPQSYTYTSGSTYDNLSVNTKNTGSASVTSSYDFYILLSTDDTPLGWGYLSDPSSSDGPFTAGETAAVEHTLFKYNATSTKIQVFMNPSLSSSAKVGRSLSTLNLEGVTIDERNKALHEATQKTILEQSQNRY